MATDPISLFLTTMLDALFGIIGALLAPVGELLAGPYDTFLRKLFGSLL